MRKYKKMSTKKIPRFRRNSMSSEQMVTRKYDLSHKINTLHNIFQHCNNAEKTEKEAEKTLKVPLTPGRILTYHEPVNYIFPLILKFLIMAEEDLLRHLKNNDLVP